MTPDKYSHPHLAEFSDALERVPSADEACGALALPLAQKRVPDWRELASVGNATPHVSPTGGRSETAAHREARGNGAT